MENDKCKICNEVISNVDSVKVCPKCGELYHKSCYEVKGCQNDSCTAKSTGGYCSYCGHIVKEGALFCTNCGKKIVRSENVCKHCGSVLPDQAEFCPTCGFSQKSIEELPEDVKEKNSDVEAFIGKKGYYYRPKFDEMKTTKNPITWNWSAFLFGSLWVAYRKQYLLLLIYEVIFIISEVLYKLGFGGEYFSTAVSFVTGLVLGLFGNYFYMLHVNKKVKKMENMNEDDKFFHCTRSGGTSGLVIVIYLLVAAMIRSVIFSFL